MCCMLTTLFVVGPRMAILVWWLIRPVYVGAAFDNPILTLLAWLFIPWTVLMYLIIYPGGIVGFWEWLLIILGILADIATYADAVRRNRNLVPGYQE